MASVEERQLPGYGRAFVATRRIRAGELILRNRAACAALNDDLLATHCGHCFQPCPRPKFSCTDCNKVVYCALCVKSPGLVNRHKDGECTALRKLFAQKKQHLVSSDQQGESKLA